MSSFKLSSRMEILAELVIKGKPAADIGTDHGFVPIYLLSEKIVPHCFLTDINSGPLMKAKGNIEAAGISRDSYTLAQGSGLAPLRPGDAESIIIAGMGGELIRDIMSAFPETAENVRRFILQPRSKSALLRAWLNDHGYVIVAERLAKEGQRICQIIAAEHRERTVLPYEDFPDALSFSVPAMLSENKDPLYPAFLQQKKKAALHILQGLCNTDDPSCLEKKAFWTQRFLSIEELIARAEDM